MKSQNKKQKREKQKRERERRRRARSGNLPDDFRIIDTPAGQERMSEVLLEFIDPYTRGLSSDEAFDKLLNLGIVAWNAALLHGSERVGFIEDIVNAFPADIRQEGRAHLADLIRRKEKHFAHNTRMIVNFSWTMGPDGPHLVVMSTLSQS